MSAHTPGPWVRNATHEGGGGFGAIRVESEHEHGEVNDGWAIAEVIGSDAEANARLIAAAPELLAACEELGRLWDAGIRPQIVQGALREETDFATLCMVTLRAAISKAKGGEA